MRSLIVILALLIVGCTSSGYQKFYRSYADPKVDVNLESLGEGQEPEVFGTDSFKRDIRLLKAKRYVVVGESSFNGGYEDIKNAVLQAKRIGATLVLTDSEYTNTQSSTSALFIPNTQTTYGSTTVPYTTHQRRYDQTAVYLVKLNKKLKFGVVVTDLSPEQRMEIERNTGALIDIVIEGEPAFNSNVMAGDILIAIDGKQVTNGDHAVQLMGGVPESQKISKLTIIRKGNEKIVVVEF